MWGLAYKQEANWDSAIEKLAMAVKINRVDPYAWHMYAFCQSMLDQYSAADRAYRSALQAIGDRNPRQKKLTLVAMAQNLLKAGGNLAAIQAIVDEARGLPGSGTSWRRVTRELEERRREMPGTT